MIKTEKNSAFYALLNSSEYIRAELMRRARSKTDDTVLIGGYVVDFDFKRGLVTLGDRLSLSTPTETDIEAFASVISEIKQ